MNTCTIQQLSCCCTHSARVNSFIFLLHLLYGQLTHHTTNTALSSILSLSATSTDSDAVPYS